MSFEAKYVNFVEPVILSGAWITLPDGSVVLQRRASGDREAGLLSAYGGKAELDESPRAALSRELSEELVLPVDSVTISDSATVFCVPKPITGRDNVEVYLYPVAINSLPESIDGSAEAHEASSLRRRVDLSLLLSIIIDLESSKYDDRAFVRARS